MNGWNFYNESEYTVNGKTYRNLEAQVQKNKQDIEDLDLAALNTLPERVNDLEQYTSAIGEDVTELWVDVGTRQLKVKKRVIPLPVASWINNQITVTVLGVTPNNLVEVSPIPDDFDTYSNSGIRCIRQAQDVLVFQSIKTLSKTVDVNVAIWD